MTSHHDTAALMNYIFSLVPIYSLIDFLCKFPAQDFNVAIQTFVCEHVQCIEKTPWKRSRPSRKYHTSHLDGGLCKFLPESQCLRHQEMAPQSSSSLDSLQYHKLSVLDQSSKRP